MQSSLSESDLNLPKDKTSLQGHLNGVSCFYMNTIVSLTEMECGYVQYRMFY